MKRLLIIVMAAPLLAQQPPAAQTPSTPAQASATPQQAAATTAQAPATNAPAATAASEPAAPAPSDENWLTGSIDLGYRWQTGVGGSFDTYRSIVNLGSGPKLVGADFTITDPKHRLFDQIQVRAYGWGDEPYETFHLYAKKKKLYDFNADYRDMAYFNFLPSYADPLLSLRGITLNEQSFDTRRRFGSFSLDLLPGNWIIPYFAYDRDSGSGTGTTVFVSDVNEFPVPNTMSDRTSLFRGGVRIERKRFHVTLEEGGTTFQNNQDVYQPPGSTNYGNSTAPYFGQTLDLTSLIASYGIHGTSTYSKGLFTANVTPWLDFYGQFLFSEPKTNVNYQQYDNGNLVLQSQLLFYTSQQYLVSAAANSPHTSGSFGAEIRPFRHVRIVESWLTDRLHDSGSASSNQILASLGVSAQMAALLTSSLVTNYNQQEIDLFYDATSKLFLHGGYRYVWGDANDAILPAAGLASADQGKLRRNVGIGGVTFHPIQKLSVSGEVEAASSGGAYFRTSLYNYQKVRAQARYQATTALSLSADFTLLNNHNPVPGVQDEYQAQQESLSFFWAPKGGKNWNIQGSYSRSTMYSDIGYLEPEFLTPQQSIYRDNAHTASGLFSANLPHYSGLTPKFTAGGSLFISSGSRPTNYYQPFAKLFLPVRKNLTWFTEWTYYGYGEVLYLYEGFRAHLVMTGLRFTR
jgi:hypothetical protein